MTLKYKIAVLLFNQVNALDVAGPLEAFANVTHENGSQAYTIETWVIGETLVQSESGLRLCADKSVPQRPQADILIIPGGRGIREFLTLRLISDWLQKNQERFGRIASICTGAYVLAEAGLVDGRTVTTHWAYAEDFRKRYPNVTVNSDALFLQDGRFYSSGGVTAGIDLALDLIESDMGGEAAMKAARELVVFLRRSGAQTQFSIPLQMQTTAADDFGDICKWIANNLHTDLSVDSLASRAGLSTRQFSRRFRKAFSMPPAAYVKRMKLDAGRTFLGQGVSIPQVAHATGYLSTDGFGRAFESQFGISPGEYQRRFKSQETGQ